MIHEANRRIAAILRRWVKNKTRWSEITGFGKSSFYAWAEEGNVVPAYALAPTFRAVPKIECLAEVIQAGDLGLSLVRTKAPNIAGDVRDEIMEVTEALGVAVATARRVLADKVVTESERRAACARFDDVIREAEEAKQALCAPSLKAVRP
jgi:hypothetical protein